MIRRYLMPVAVMFTYAALLAANAPEAPPASSYAPAEELTTQFNAYLAEMEESLAGDDYSAAQRGRVFKLSNTVAALALVLANHDQENAIQPRAAAIVAAAGELSTASDDHQPAKAAFAKLKQAVAAEPGEALPWKPVADLTALMEQVPVINSKLKRAVRRLERNQQEAAVDAATLAAIAQAAMYDHSAVVDEADLAQWYEFTAQMRDAAGETA
ncbi:MAG: hypothetical protein WEA31_03010, partial [Pirellulales bacterium]